MQCSNVLEAKFEICTNSNSWPYPTHEAGSWCFFSGHSLSNTQHI